MAVLSPYPFVFAMGMISLFLAAFTSSRRFATMIATTILVVSYFGSNLAASTPLLEPFEPFFLYTYLDGTGEAIKNGQETGDTLVLLGLDWPHLPGPDLLPDPQTDSGRLALAKR